MRYQSQRTKSNQTTPSSWPPHFAIIELKHCVLSSLSKLADRDTHHIALQHLHRVINSLSNHAVPMLLNCLCDAVSNHPNPVVKRESIRLLAALCAVHTHSASAHLTKIIARIVRRLGDVDSQVRDACRDAIGTLAELYLKGGADGIVLVFMKPLLEVMSENSKTAQGGAALCLAKMVECASEPPLVAFKKLCFRVIKYLNSPHFMAKASLLQLLSSLSQAGAIAPQSLEPLLHGIQECLGSSDWATRKSAAELLTVLSLNASNIEPKSVSSTLNILEGCRFDKIKSVRESIAEALQLWKKVARNRRGSSDGHKASSHDGEASESGDMSYAKNLPILVERGSENSLESSASSFKGKVNNIPDKAMEILKKKAPTLTYKELNPGFFQKLETRVSGELPVEVIVAHRCANLINSKKVEESELNDVGAGWNTLSSQVGDGSFEGKYECMERGAIDNHSVSNEREPITVYADCSRNSGLSEGFMNNNGNWLAIQRQLSLLERQQSHLMHMLQDFIGGSQDGMVTLENRVRGLERVVEGVTGDLSLSTGRSSSNTTVGRKYNGFRDYSGARLGRVSNGHIHFRKRFAAFDSVSSEAKGRSPSLRSDTSDGREFHAYTEFENEADQIDSRRAWEKGARPIWFSRGPSARSVWRGSKEEATLEAIRVAADDNGVAWSSETATPEMIDEAIREDESEKERDSVWTCWSKAMDALHAGDVDSAFAEVFSTGDDILLVKLMKRSGPVIDQLSDEVASEVMHAVSLYLMEHNLFEMCLHWVQQLVDIIMENDPDVLEIPTEVKTEILLNLHEASSSMNLNEDWDGSAPDQLFLQLASAWDIDLQCFGK